MQVLAQERLKHLLTSEFFVCTDVSKKLLKGTYRLKYTLNHLLGKNYVMFTPKTKSGSTPWVYFKSTNVKEEIFSNANT